MGNQWQQCTFVCTCVRDLLPGAYNPALTAWTFSQYNILLFLLSQFYNHCTKMLAVSILLLHSYCDIVFLIIQFKEYLYIFYTTLKGFFLITAFNRCFFLLDNMIIKEDNSSWYIKIIYSSLKCTTLLCFLLGFEYCAMCFYCVKFSSYHDKT